MAHSLPQTRLHRIEQAMLQQMIAEALQRARHVPRADFARVLVRWLPAQEEALWVDFDLLSTDEVQRLSEYAYEYLGP